MEAVEKFHLLTQIFVSALGGILLLAIWYNIRRRFHRILEEDDNQKRVDKGLVYLSLALFTWVLSGAWSLAGLTEVVAVSEGTQQVIRSLFSILNNLFFLLALFFFHHAPGFLYKNEKNTARVIVFITSISVISLLLFNYRDSLPQMTDVYLPSLPDLLSSGFLSVLLAISFYRTFRYRGFQRIAYISVVIISAMFLSQLPEVFTFLKDEFANNLLRIVSKVSLITLFLVLATSWVIQLANTPVAGDIRLKFTDWSLIQLSVPSKDITNASVDFGSKTTQFRNLLKFGIRRKFAAGSEQCIEVHAAGEISRQTYLTRIIENINDILQKEEGEKLERRDLFTFVGNGQYRLRIPPENIAIDDALLSEFTQSPENQAYSKFCNNL